MKYILQNLFLVILFSVWCPNLIMSANDNQLITEIKVNNNDSVFRFQYLYDNQGNKVLETKYYQQDSALIRKSLNEWIYDGNKCVLQRERIWSNDQWLVTYSIDYNYNNGLLDSENHKYYTDGLAYQLKKIDYKYNSTKLTSKREYLWQNNSWNLSIESDFTYLADGKTDSITLNDYISGNLHSQMLYKFTYNPEGTLSTQLIQEKVDSNWINSELINWYYQPSSNQIVTQKNKKWISSNSSWENTQRIDYQYNDSNLLLSESYQRWKSVFWENDIRYDYQYDQTNILLKKILSKPLYNDWRSIISINYSDFTLNKANKIESMYEFWGGNKGELTTSYIPFMFNDELIIQKGNSIQISYLPVVDSLLTNPQIENQNLFKAYPNPSIGVFYINPQGSTVKSWSVFDLNGRILKKENNLFQTGVIDITEFPKGIYILKIFTEQTQMYQKIIKN